VDLGPFSSLDAVVSFPEGLRAASGTLTAESTNTTMNSTSNGVTAVEVGQLIVCILGVVIGLAGIATLSPGWAIFGAILVLLGLGCFALQQALGD